MKSMKWLLVVGSLLLASLIVIPSSASANTPGCVTRSEFRQVKNGMKKPRVEKLFQTRGKITDGHAGGYTTAYRKCNASDRAYVSFTDWDHKKKKHLRPHRVVEKRWTAHY